MAEIQSAASGTELLSTAAYFWVRASETDQVNSSEPWFCGIKDTVQGEDAVLFKHPARCKALAKDLDGEPMSLAEAYYVEFRLPLGGCR